MNTTAATILIVDDDTAHRTMLTTLISGWGYKTEQADDGQTAIDKVNRRAYDLVLMDVRMVKVSGIAALAEIKAVNPAIPVIIMTAYSSVETAVAALKKGAHDYLTKPLDFDKLKTTLQRSMAHLRPDDENENRPFEARFKRGRIIGSSPALKAVLAVVAQVAPTEAVVLISGESGTGKELIANAVHYNSTRRKGPFVKINCAALSPTLLEAELFGHEKGAFTGAESRKEGTFVQANGGTLFLDEVGEMPLAMQAKLLRVLQEREVVRVGGRDIIRIDTRIITATNRNLSQMIDQGRFREDLYYRLNVVNLQLPPLRTRRPDIAELAGHFLHKFSEKNGKSIKGFAPAAMERLLAYDWPGNVRELMNVVERCVVLGSGEYISDAALFPDLPTEEPPGLSPGNTAATALEEVEKKTILKVLENTAGNKSEAARQLGITRKTLYKKLRQYGVV